MIVREVDAGATHDLRRRVLRAGDPEASVSWTGDIDESTVHLAGVVEDVIVGISTWLVDEHGDVQLRGMATDPEFVGRSVGTELLDAGLDRARRRGASRVWANARLTALGFYERAGFEVSGPVFTTEQTGLPHRRVTYALG